MSVGNIVLYQGTAIGSDIKIPFISWFYICYSLKHLKYKKLVVICSYLLDEFDVILSLPLYFFTRFENCEQITPSYF